MRNAFIDELIALAQIRSNIALIVGDLGFSVVEPFIERFPDRFVNAGVAEQNMAGLAAGMASEGFHVFIYSIANFPTFRCAEQIRNDIDYHKLPVTVVAVGGGVAYGALGYSHHAVQDYALLRTFPNMLIAAPGDPFEVRGCMRYIVNHPGPSYLRLGKAGEPVFHEAIPSVSPGEWLRIRQGDSDGRSAIVCTGATMELGLKFCKHAKYRGCAVYSVPLWSMACKEKQARMLAMHDRIVVLEDHLVDGGFGSWLLEARALWGPATCAIELVSLKASVCGTVGAQNTLNAYGGLSVPSD